jgi:hypothetical protein
MLPVARLCLSSTVSSSVFLATLYFVDTRLSKVTSRIRFLIDVVANVHRLSCFSGTRELLQKTRTVALVLLSDVSHHPEVIYHR